MYAVTMEKSVNGYDDHALFATLSVRSRKMMMAVIGRNFPTSTTYAEARRTLIERWESFTDSERSNVLAQCK